MRAILKRLLPDRLRRACRSWSVYDHFQARHLAATSKRIDLCAAQFAHVLSLADWLPLKDKVCLEVGCGWVLSHALVCYLLGAKKVIATDIVNQAFPQSLNRAVRSAVSSMPQDLLSPFEDHAQLRERFKHLQETKRFDLAKLREFGIEYVAPIDLATTALDEQVDFIYSISVLEHVPCSDVAALLHNLIVTLREGGTMIHCFHLEDHQNIAQKPFAFLSLPADAFSPIVQSDRGNRLRRSEWERLFSSLPGTQTRPLYAWSREDTELPQQIDSSISYVDEADLRVSHLAFCTRKSLSNP